MPETTSRKQARAAQAAETRQRLIDTAVDLFADNPYDKVGVTDIVEAADVAHGLLFHYFGNKRGIYLEAMRATADGLSQSFANLPDGAPDVQIRAALAAHLTHLRTHRGLALRMILGGRGADPEAWQVFEDARTGALIAGATLLGLDPHNAAVALAGRAAVAAIDETTARWLDDTAFSVDAMVEMLIHVIAACLETAPLLDPTVSVTAAVATILGGDIERAVSRGFSE
ncbi:TetR/AcrR family transcriptional regulator [Rhodococcus sovatensis]|uniref:TetR/AcrR family transcriptional regulator n=1 Tax=Rhodococcus sovatensis TaxID=1805840 RepID=A0ABZ2PDI9_9NOCA